MQKFKGKYRIQSTRLQGRDYADPGKYFITICVKNRECVLGRIENGEMILSSPGEIVQSEWLKTPEIRKNVQLDEFQIMPNHWHGIIVITHRVVAGTHGNGNGATPTDGETHTNWENHTNVETHCNASLQPQPQTNPQPNTQPQLQPPDTVYKNKFGPQRNNLSSIVRGIKLKSTILIRKSLMPNFQWQPRFHDHIVLQLAEGGAFGAQNCQAATKIIKCTKL